MQKWKAYYKKIRLFLFEQRITTRQSNKSYIQYCILKDNGGCEKRRICRVFTKLEAVAKVQSVKRFNAIEGYRDALNAIYLHHDTLDLRQSDILRLYKMMIQISGYELLSIPFVVLDFLCIRPFRDGNGRMSRLLSLLLLYNNGMMPESMSPLRNR